MDDIARAANTSGFKVWGFSPHSPLCIDSPCNMKESDVPSYLHEINRLRQLYPDMKILAGMEVDYIDDEHGPSSSAVKGYGLDYIIGSVHFIPNKNGEYYDIDGSPERFKTCLATHFDNDLLYVIKTFWLQTQRMIKKGGFNIIGHIDKIALNASYVDGGIEQSVLYKKMANDTIDLAIASGADIEINTKHLKKYGRFFPSPVYWKKILHSGVRMPVNTDAHYADRIEDGRDEAFAELKRLGLL